MVADDGAGPDTKGTPTMTRTVPRALTKPGQAPSRDISAVFENPPPITPENNRRAVLRALEFVLRSQDRSPQPTTTTATIQEATTLLTMMGLDPWAAKHPQP